MKTKLSFKEKLTRVGIVAAVPLIAFVVMEALTLIVAGKNVFSSTMELYNLVKTTTQLSLTAIALSLNMSTGRMDFSLGAQQLVGCVIGGNLAVSLGFGPILTLLTIIIFGAASGLMTGLLFVLLRIPSMILGIGMALIYECICSYVSVDGFQVYGKTQLGLWSNAGFCFVVLAVIVAIMIVLNGYTKFGYHYKAIRETQQISKLAGINVNVNCIVCYTLAGGIIAIAGAFSASYSGVLSSSMGMGSVVVVFTALLPVFIAMYLSRYCNMIIAILVGALTSKILSVGLIQLALPSPALTVIDRAVLLIFLLIANYTKLGDHKKLVKARIESTKADRV